MHANLFWICISSLSELCSDHFRLWSWGEQAERRAGDCLPQQARAPLLHGGAGTGSTNRASSEIIHARELTSAWIQWWNFWPHYLWKNWDTWIWLPEGLQSDMLRWIAALAGDPYLKSASRSKYSLLLASLMSSTEIFGLQDRSLVKADQNMPSPVNSNCKDLLVVWFFFWNTVIA